MAEPVFNDREWVAQHQQAQQAEQNAVIQVDHYQALGIGLAAFAVAMYTALKEDGTFSVRDALELVKAAVQGR